MILQISGDKMERRLNTKLFVWDYDNFIKK